MMNKFKELLLKKAKDGKFLSEEDKAAKMEVLDGIKELMSDSMGKDLKGLKKVTVASPTEEGLKAGLEKADEVVSEKLDSEESSDDSEEECAMCKDGEMCPECKAKMMVADSSNEEPSKEDKIKKLEEELAKLKGESDAAMA